MFALMLEKIRIEQEIGAVGEFRAILLPFDMIEISKDGGSDEIW